MNMSSCMNLSRCISLEQVWKFRDSVLYTQILVCYSIVYWKSRMPCMLIKDGHSSLTCCLVGALWALVSVGTHVSRLLYLLKML